MGILSRGKYTYGNKTWAQIISITGANIGDTVWDTTYNKRRIWDGNNFIHGNQKSLETTGAVSNGTVAVSSSTANSKISFQTGSPDSEGIIGVIEDSKAGTAGTIVTMTYHGDVKALINATGSNFANVPDYIYNSATVTGQGEPSSSGGVGVFALYLDITVGVPGLYRILLKSSERY